MEFYATQNVHYYADVIDLSALQLATINREISEWLNLYYTELL